MCPYATQVQLQRVAHDQGRKKAQIAMVQRNVEAAGRQQTAQLVEAAQRVADLTKVVCQMRSVRVQARRGPPAAFVAAPQCIATRCDVTTSR